MNKPMANKKANTEKDNITLTEEKFDPITEFSDDITAYDIQYYHDAIFALKGSKEELKYPYLISGYINCCPVDKDLKGLSPIHIAQSVGIFHIRNLDFDVNKTCYYVSNNLLKCAEFQLIRRKCAKLRKAN